MKKKQILLTDIVTLSRNYGSQAITLPLVEELSKNAHCVLALSPKFLVQNRQFARNNRLNIIAEPNTITALSLVSVWFKMLNFIRNFYLRLSGRRQTLDEEKKHLSIFIKNLKQSEFAIDACGIEFVGNTSLVKKWLQLLKTAVGQTLSAKFHKPYFKYTKSYGPFHGLFYRFIVKKLLTKLPFILIRAGRGESANFQEVKKLNLSQPIYSFADISIMLRPAPAAWAKKYLQTQKISLKKPIIGLSPSAVIRALPSEWASGKNHLNLCLKIIEFFQAEHQIVLLPHALGEGQNPKTSDLALVREIYSQLKNRRNVFVLSDQTLTYAQVRAIIGLFNFYICGRFHGVASALNRAVPVVPLAWHIKYDDLMALFLAKYPLINSRKLTVNQALSKIKISYQNQNWFNRDEVLKKKEAIIREIKKSLKLMVSEEI